MTKFDASLSSGGHTEPGYMQLGNRLDPNTILHEAIHYGTAVWRSTDGVPPILDLGNIGTYGNYGSLTASLERAHVGWGMTSISAASYSWVVTGP